MTDLDGGMVQYERAVETATAIRERLAYVPAIAVVLGSGLGPMADRLTGSTILPYAAIPHFPRPTVDGHAGNLIVGRFGGTGIGTFMLQGRFHYYEGHDLAEATFPVRVLKILGVKTLILTAATGGIREDLGPGSLVCLTDHLNLLGSNPLRGPNDERFGLRFPDMSCVYSATYRSIAADVAHSLGVRLSEGIYACLPGPSYETPAEIRMLRTLGADVVGMSTVPEAIVARHCGMQVLAFALVTNFAAGVSGKTIDHTEVIEEGRKAGPSLGRIIEGVIARVADSG